MPIILSRISDIIEMAKANINVYKLEIMTLSIERMLKHLASIKSKSKCLQIVN